MAIESSVYSELPPISLLQLIDAARLTGWETRAYDEEDSSFRPIETPELPMENVGLVLIGWAASESELTTVVDEAMGRGDKDTVDNLGQEGRVAWCDLVCVPYDDEEHWADLPEEREEFEEDLPAEFLAGMRRAKTAYHLRCGTRPPQNGRLLAQIGEVIRDTATGILDTGCY